MERGLGPLERNSTWLRRPPGRKKEENSIMIDYSKIVPFDTAYLSGFLADKYDVEAKAAVKAAYAYEGPVYIRLGRLAVPVFHDAEHFNFEIGKGEQLTEGSDVAIIATGLMVNEALMAAESLKTQGIHARVINICTIKPLDEEIVLKAARECGKVITCEEHSIIGGLGEAVAALLSEKCPTRLRRIGVNDEFGHSGPAAALLKQFGLSAEHIEQVAKEMLNG